MSIFRNIRAFAGRLLVSMAIAGMLGGCISEDSSDAPAGIDSASNGVSSATSVNVAGSVGDGPVTGAKIEVWSSGGQLLGSMMSDSTASFGSTFKVKGKEYPLVLKVKGGIDLVTGSSPDFQMSSVMLNPSDKQVNITPFSTLVVLVAERMPGGLNSSNVASALDYVTGTLGFGLDSTLVENPITSDVTEANVANLVKSSEAFGEMVRRTRDLVTASGRYIVGDDVLLALAEDLQDGALDGQGASGVDVMISAIAHVVSGQVLVEALSNNLKVDGVVATGVIDQAIMTTRPQTDASQLTDSVRVTADMLQQAQNAMAALQVVDSSSEVQGIAASISSVAVNSLPDEVESVLPANTSALLDDALIQTAYADQDKFLTINLAANGGYTVANTGSSGSGGDTGSGGIVDTTTQNTAPLINGTPVLSIVAGVSYQFQPAASDADNDALVFSINNQPGWATFSPATGLLSGMPGIGDVGDYSNIIISVSDGILSADLDAFDISVTAPAVVNTPPYIDGVPPPSVVANSSYQFQPNASDADGDTLTFSVSNLPGWATFDASTGRLGGTPLGGDAGTYKNIVISVSDGKDSASMPAFDVQVTVPVVVNNPPVISGIPVTSVIANNGYLFQPSATDADNDTLTFSVTNLPVWAGFDVSTGRINGSPDDNDVGSYAGIVISVTDGQDVAQLQPFDITVDPDPSQSGVLSLAWTAPTARADGSPLAMSEIDGFHIHYGNTPGGYTDTVTISDGSANGTTISNLPVGTYYLVMTAYDVNGLESQYSAEISKNTQ